MAIREGDVANNLLLDEERRQASHQEVKSKISDDVKTRLKHESARVEPKESAELVGAAHEMKRKVVQEAVESERDLARGRVTARVSQIIDYLFYLVYGLIGLQFVLKLLGARPGNGFVQFVADLSWPVLAPFRAIVPTPSMGASRLELSYLLALGVYLLLHLAINGFLRLVVNRKVKI
ncbi:MAG TPA: YggT family protein [Blastocatellia bacterium]|nr:YggT family protein [Blastocatellia bacterium]